MRTSKVCNRCKKEKPVLDFTPRPERPIGIYGICKECKSAARSKRYKERKKKAPKELWVAGARNNAKDRARRSGVYFELALEEVLEALKVSKGKCGYCGCHLDFQLTRKDLKRRWKAPSLDRIVPGLGYVLENVLVCCYRCNAIKNNATPQELRTLAEAVDRLVRDRNLS